jgi:hypothetical protein
MKALQKQAPRAAVKGGAFCFGRGTNGGHNKLQNMNKLQILTVS